MPLQFQDPLPADIAFIVVVGCCTYIVAKYYDIYELIIIVIYYDPFPLEPQSKKMSRMHESLRLETRNL